MIATIPSDNYFSSGYFKKRQTEIARSYYPNDFFKDLSQEERNGIRRHILREAQRKQLSLMTRGQK